MSSEVTRAPRDVVKQVRLNFWLQFAFAVPFLLIFGATPLNGGLVAVFLALATIRWAYPYSEFLRKTELYAALALTAVWVLVRVL